MDKPPPDPAAFRASATAMYRLICAGLVALVVGTSWIGWHFGGWIGLAIGAFGGLVVAVAVAVWFGATLIWAMTQDGA